jgi:hypothetical protein
MRGQQHREIEAREDGRYQELNLVFVSFTDITHSNKNTYHHSWRDPSRLFVV